MAKTERDAASKMHHDNLQHWQHTHAFGQDRKRPGELRTIIVIAVTATMMVVEITTGILFGSMALLADGLHMASHAAALTINAFAYICARRHAHDTTYSFGTGKINALGGFTGAVLLVIFALMMTWESVERIIYPVEIAFNQAIFVAVLGLIVNGASVFILGHHHGHDDHEHHEHEHHHHHHHHHHHDHDHDHDHDHNLRAAYLHVMADALTSILAIFALLAAKYMGLIWMDPLMGMVGAVLVSRWSLGLLRTTSAVLLDKQGPEEIQTIIKDSIEDDDNRVADLHFWSIGPNIYAVIVSVVAHDPKPPKHYKELIPASLGLVHVTVEVHECIEEEKVSGTVYRH
ncbi:MAG: CDF family Co(II)/Ni(II) efflux transporter DmeF [Pirellulaceae bacterium]